MLGVYDSRSRSALAVISKFRASPAPEEAIAFQDGAPRAGFDESRLDDLREAAVLARALSPRWLTVRRDGGIVVAREQEGLIRSLAGFYGCRLLPTAELPGGGRCLPTRPRPPAWPEASAPRRGSSTPEA
ncbi:MAG: hypothetical protein M0D55_05395 [Elusimicrobiota bacterium]|nr:MAG: hypothetical protein M0D55_05395 [Elusimicrobiota bacterium]